MNSLRTLSLDDIARKAPSVFATEPYHGVSERYSFISTADIVERALGEGLVPVSARQSRAKDERVGYTRHEVRFVRESDLGNPKRIVGDSYYQMLLTNSHDRGAAFKLDAGLFRLVCSNGMTVPTGTAQSLRLRHTGDVSDVIEGVFSVLDEQDDVFARIEDYRAATLPVEAQVAYATAALELRSSALEVTPAQLLRPRRWVDAAEGRSDLPKPDLWTTLNVVQENLQKGGIVGRSGTGRRIRTRTMTNIAEDQKLNKSLFILADALKKFL